MTKMEHFEAMGKIGASMALLKAHSTKTAEFCVREAMHIFGGSGLVKRFFFKLLKNFNFNLF